MASAENIQPGRFDPGSRRRSQRAGRERGCWVYIPAEQLRRAGIDPNSPAPWYRTWAARSGGVLVRLYREEEPSP